MLRSNEANLFLLAKMSSGHTQINLSCGIALSKNIQVIVLPSPQNSLYRCPIPTRVIGRALGPDLV